MNKIFKWTYHKKWRLANKPIKMIHSSKICKLRPQWAITTAHQIEWWKLRRLTISVLGENVEYLGLSKLLVEILSDLATLKKRWAVYFKVKYVLIIRLSDSTTQLFVQEEKNHVSSSQNDLNVSVHRSFIPKLKTA